LGCLTIDSLISVMIDTVWTSRFIFVSFSLFRGVMHRLTASSLKEQQTHNTLHDLSFRKQSCKLSVNRRCTVVLIFAKNSLQDHAKT